MAESDAVEAAVDTENNEDESTGISQETNAEASSQQTNNAATTTQINNGDTHGENKDLAKKNKNSDKKGHLSKKLAKYEKDGDYFSFNINEPESSDDEVLEGEELERQLALNKKMHEEVVQEMKKHNDTPFFQDFLRNFKSGMTPEEFKKSELQIYAACLPHPYPL